MFNRYEEGVMPMGGSSGDVRFGGNARPTSAGGGGRGFGRFN